MTVRCKWCGDDPLYIKYHDEEWGRPVHDDGRFFEKLVLEGMQAGLSWITILRKRENFRQAFDNFDIKTVANYDDTKVEELMQNAGIIRNRLKIKSAISNAKIFMDIQAEYGSFDAYIWQFVEGKTITNHWEALSDMPAETDESRAMSKALKKRGFKFVGPTICYSFMQSLGMVNDHSTDCFLHPDKR
ncbi:MAG: DNA-3-methyladenine glycosylase I [Anaerolineae bacterium]|nr:DNA-3-methyladenine glycosylase I [Anaerolineae bacterium]MDQ7035379.1 DNA-3-methyladenine glycosylase I [Anaerolineae bacterium]